MKRSLLLLLAIACESELDKARAAAAKACAGGDGQQCFVAAVGLDATKPRELARGVKLWARGCQLEHAASCAQLGTVAEFGLESGGENPDPIGARLYYAKACRFGDPSSCERAGMPSPPPKAAAYDWSAALAQVCGPGKGELGPLFDGLVPGEPMPEAVKQRVAAFEKERGAYVHYYPGDPDTLSRWFLEVRFDGEEGLVAALTRRWGAANLRWGDWWGQRTHASASEQTYDRKNRITFAPFRSVAEVIQPEDPKALGIEPFPVVGSMLKDVQDAMGRRMLRSAEDEYRWTEVAPGGGLEVRIREKRGVVVELRTVNWLTNASEVGDALFAALEQKWGPPNVDAAGVRTWKLPGRTVRASKPVTGNFELVITALR